MSKISLDLSSIKSPGVYTVEIDDTQRTEALAQALRILVGFSGKGPFNRPVFLQNEALVQKIYGDIDTKLEKKGCYFNRAAKTMISGGAILGLNLLKVDDSYEGPDQVNYVSFSLDAAKSNPRVADAGKVYGEVDYLADTIDNTIYNTSTGDVIPFIGKTPYASLFDRSRFWVPSENNLMQVASAGLGVGSTSFEKANFLNFANCGTDEISILVYKPENYVGYDITAKDWYGNEADIPYGWIRPSDYISDYFIRVIAVKGNWSNYPLLASDKTWGKYFDKKGIRKDKVSQFCQAEGVQFIGSWTGCIFNLEDKQGNQLYIKDRVNAQSQTTGLLMSINEDAMEVISYDLNGLDKETGEADGNGNWIYDYDGNAEAESEYGETEIAQNGFIIDMVGHGFQNGLKKEIKTEELKNQFDTIIFDSSVGTLSGVPGSKVYYLDDAEQLSNISGLSYATKVKVPEFNTSGQPLYLYGVYDGTTNRRLADDYSYVSVTANDATSLTQAKIKTQQTFNAAGETDNKTVNTKISADAGTLKLKNDLKDNVKYKTVDALYGNYAAFDTNEKVLYLYSIDGEGVQDEEIVTLDKMADVAEDLTIAGTGTSTTTVSKGDLKQYAAKAAGLTVIINVKTGKMYVNAETNTPAVYGVNFLSYNYVSDNSEDVLCNVRNCYYFNGKKNSSETNDVTLVDTDLFFGDAPVPADSLNQFIITDEEEAANITVGDLIQNITFFNTAGVATRFGLIPGVTRVTRKIFVNITSDNKFTYDRNTYRFNTGVAAPIRTRTGKRGFYLITTIDPVYINSKNRVTRQLPITNNVISESLRFVPLKGLHISAKHRPGYDAQGRISLEGGIKKIYSVLEEEGIHRALCDTKAISFRYIVDSCSGGLDNEMGGKVYLSRLAMDRGKCTALLNAPSKLQFELSSDPVFCDYYSAQDYVKPSFDTKYIPLGGNVDMYNTKQFTLPTEDDGSKFTGVFFPHLLVNDGRRQPILVPPAADVSNTFVQKFTGGDPYAICAGVNGGVINNGRVTGVEYSLDNQDRDYLNPFGINSIIQLQNGQIVIYGNQSAYQDTISDFNKLHVRENLNTLELACDQVLDTFTFKYNNSKTRAEVVMTLTPIFETMKNSGALDWYELKCDEENNTPDVIAADFLIIDSTVQMGHGAEKIINRITLTRNDMPN